MKRMTVSVLALALSAVAGGASAGFQDYGSRYDNRYDNDRDRVVSAPRSDIATVIRVEPMYDGRGGGGYDGGYQRQECWNESANRYDGGYYRDQNGRLYRGDYNNRSSGGSTLLGALIGGALGNQVGKGDGRKAATIAGAVIGGAIANNQADGRYADGRYDEYRDDRGVVRRCRIVNEPGYGGGQANGYNVTYRYAGQTYQAYTRYRPGRTMRVMVDVRPQDGTAYRR